MVEKFNLTKEILHHFNNGLGHVLVINLTYSFKVVNNLIYSGLISLINRTK